MQNIDRQRDAAKAPRPCGWSFGETKMAQLIEPSTHYEVAFLAMYQMYRNCGEVDWCESHADALTDFPHFVKRLSNDSMGLGLSTGWVPTSHFWLIQEDYIAGTFRIRHRLTPVVTETAGHIGYDIAPPFRGRGLGHEILRLGLIEASKLGIRDVLAICAETNIPSMKILMRYGIIERILENGDTVFMIRNEHAEHSPPDGRGEAPRH